MKIYKIHTLILRNVEIVIEKSLCFMHDYELLGVSLENVQRELENSIMYVYTADFYSYIRMSKCPWCDESVSNLTEHIALKHAKTYTNLQMFKFQQEMYRERLRLLRAKKIDHTYFVYLNQGCQFCDDMRKRGRGLCSKPESARNKARSLLSIGFKAKNFPHTFLFKPNLAYIIGRPI